MRKQSGFTVIELIITILVLASAGVIFLVQKNNLSAGHRDTQRKTAINAIYYNLEEIVYPKLGGYPATLDAKQLKAMDSELLKDPNGTAIGESGSDYSYEPSSCNGDICEHYVLRASLEREAAFERKSRN
ncbi:MAG TPA: type II secretion system protein [Candidatus Saccharibacteria bacterium]|nr:type II secretion system protein [Candidatus Saccharibacteria bacterium]